MTPNRMLKLALPRPWKLIPTAVGTLGTGWVLKADDLGETPIAFFPDKAVFTDVKALNHSQPYANALLVLNLVNEFQPGQTAAPSVNQELVKSARDAETLLDHLLADHADADSLRVLEALSKALRRSDEVTPNGVKEAA